MVQYVKKEIEDTIAINEFDEISENKVDIEFNFGKVIGKKNF